MVLATKGKKIKIKHEKVSFIGRSYKNYNKENFTQNLLNQNWLIFDTETNPEILWNTMVDNITKCIDHLCPLKKFRVRSTSSKKG